MLGMAVLQEMVHGPQVRWTERQELTRKSLQPLFFNLSVVTTSKELLRNF